jgi:hypothetical protein
MSLKTGDTVMRVSWSRTSPHDPHEVVEVREATGKVVLRSRRGGKAVTVKLANIGHGADAGTTYYVESAP